MAAQVRDLKRNISQLIDIEGSTPSERWRTAGSLWSAGNQQLALDLKIMGQLVEVLEKDKPDSKGVLPVLDAVVGLLTDKKGEGIVGSLDLHVMVKTAAILWWLLTDR